MGILTQRETAVIETIAETLFPPEGRTSVTADEARVVAYIDRFLQRLPLVEQLGMRALFQVIEFGMVATTMNPRARFTTASFDDRRRYFESWDLSDNPARKSVYNAIRSMMTIAYTSSEAVMSAMDQRTREALVDNELKKVSEAAREAIAEPKPRRKSSPKASASSTVSAE